MIQRIGFVVLLMLVTALQASAQSKQETAVASAVEALRKAMVDGDRASLEKLTIEGLSYGHSSGKIEDRASFVENIANGNSDFATIELSDQTIFVSGNTAIVRHKLSGTTQDKGKAPGKVNINIMTVWQKVNKDWKMLARQAIKLP